MRWIADPGFQAHRSLKQRCSAAQRSEDTIGRIWVRQSKLERCLDENGNRPQGMRRATHERIVMRIIDCEGLRDAAIAGYMLRLGLVDVL